MAHERRITPPAKEEALMRATKLILLEGVPGSGKSTLAQTLLRHLHRQGIAATWWYEEDMQHPLYIFHDEVSLRQVLDDLSGGHYRRVVARALTQWQRFADDLRDAEGVVLLDSCLFGYLTWSLFPLEVPEQEIHAYLAAVERIIAPIDPCLIYLYQDDMARSLRRVCDHRGADIEHTYIQQVEESAYGKRRGLAGFDGLVVYWTAYREITDAAFSAISRPRLAIETSAGAWRDYQCQALDFLGLPRIDDGVAVAEGLERFVGLYRSVDNDPSITCTVSLEQGSLLLDGPPGVWPRARLLPKAPSVFDVASLPIEVSFAINVVKDSGTMTIAGPRLFGGKVAGRFEKESAQIA